jgi:hypothetical protein
LFLVALFSMSCSAPWAVITAHDIDHSGGAEQQAKSERSAAGDGIAMERVAGAPEPGQFSKTGTFTCIDCRQNGERRDFRERRLPGLILDAWL